MERVTVTSGKDFRTLQVKKIRFYKMHRSKKKLLDRTNNHPCYEPGQIKSAVIGLLYLCTKMIVVIEW